MVIIWGIVVETLLQKSQFWSKTVKTYTKVYRTCRRRTSNSWVVIFIRSDNWCWIDLIGNNARWVRKLKNGQFSRFWLFRFWDNILPLVNGDPVSKRFWPESDFESTHSSTIFGVSWLSTAKLQPIQALWQLVRQLFRSLLQMFHLKVSVSTFVSWVESLRTWRKSHVILEVIWNYKFHRLIS